MSAAGDGDRVPATPVRRALLLASAGALSLSLLAGLTLLLGAGMSGRAEADTCRTTGLPALGADDPAGDAAPAELSTRTEQLAHARTIDEVAEKHGLSGRATLIALMTALQESALLNLDYGDRDSLGLFQQRPSQGWGSPAEVRNPEYAAAAFFTGTQPDSGPEVPGLTDLDDWVSMPLGDAAQAVQLSAYPDLYAGQENAARGVAREAGIDLGRAGTEPDPAEVEESGPDPVGCDTDEAGDGSSGLFEDGGGDWPGAVANPAGLRAAAAYARREAESGGKDWYQRCLAFVAQAYGWNYSGVQYAIDHYRTMPRAMRHDKDRSPPPGALMYWDTGLRAGHVALYLGDGKIASNDILRPGYIDIVPAEEVEERWGATYEGWAPPYFPLGG